MEELYDYMDNLFGRCLPIKQLNHVAAVLFSTMIVLLCLFVTSCSAEKVVVSSESTMEGNQCSISSASEPNIPLREMSYEDYFSKERKWVDISNPTYTYRFDFEEKGPVTRFNLETDPATGKKNKVSPVVISNKLGEVTEFADAYKTLLFVIDEKQIIQTDEKGQNQKLIYEDSKIISNIFATRELIYFLRGEHTVCRIHRQSGTLDEIVKTNKEISSFRPLSNYAGLWSVDTEEFKAFDATGALWEDAPPGLKKSDRYISNSKTHETQEVSESDYDAYGFLKYKIEEK